MKRYRLHFLAAVALVAVAGIAWRAGFIAPHAHEPAAHQVLYWYDPMQPAQHFDKPGKSPYMDMQLLPRYADEDAGAPGSAGVQVDPGIAQSLGIRTAVVKRGAASGGLAVVGAVEADERRVVAVESRAAGWAEQLPVRTAGESVRRGQLLAGVYSPELFAAQQELVLAAGSGDAGLLAATRQRMALLGLSEGQIQQVIDSRQAQRLASVFAPTDGVVTELNVRQGQQVMPGTPLMRITDLSRVWITIEVPEAQAAAVKKGGKAQARLSALPGRAFDGTVEYVYPSLDAQTRTVRARVSFANPGLDLKPGMFADVALAGGNTRDVLLVPTEAVIRTGERTVVILALGEGRFRPAVVQAGADHLGQTEILSGLDEGEAIVVSGQFLIDSEASLRSVLARMAPAEKP